MAKTMKEEIIEMLKGIDRYNPNNLVCLENYVLSQVKENEYDLEANLAVLKLYQFNPNTFKTHIAVNILVKALTSMPNADFILCKCLIDPSYLESDEKIQKIAHIHKLLETCQFKEFWDEVKSNVDIFDSVNGFYDAIRKYICYVVSITYQRIERSSLREMFDLSDDKLNEWMQNYGWKAMDNDLVFVANQEEMIKTKNITEKIDFESVSSVLATYR